MNSDSGDKVSSPGGIRLWVIGVVTAIALAAIGITFIARPEPSLLPAAAIPIEGELRPGERAANIRFRILEVWPHDPSAFTQGLLFHDGLFYESTGQYGESSLREVEPATGRVRRRHNLDRQYFGEGLALVGGELTQLTWRERKAFVYNLTDFALKRQLAYEGEGWGLAFDGKSLIMSDGSSVLQFRDPVRFNVTRRVRVREGDRPVEQLNELCMIDGMLYANVFQTDRIARINPMSGQVTGWLDLSGLLTPQEAAEADVLNGIAWDSETGRVFVTGKYWPKLFVLELE